MGASIYCTVMDLGARLRTLRPDRSRYVVGAYRSSRRLAERVGIQFLVRSFYTPIPQLRGLSDAPWERQSPLAGIDLGLERQAAFLAGELAPHLAEFRPTVAEYDPANGSYPPVDADLLFAMVRRLRPRRIVELGSGHSTLVAALAARANAADGEAPEYRVFDPWPDVASAAIPGVTALEPLTARDVPLERFRALGEGDVLLVDTTHTVKVGGDVNRIVLEILPELAPGVVVHFHDIFLPHEYPRSWIEDLGLIWQEQYLLQAFLAMNPGYEVVLSNHALSRARPELMARHVRGWSEGAAPAAFWIRRS